MGPLLLTNDDGADSPALAPLARALARLGEVSVVVPAAERSWIGKAITRWEKLRVRRSQVDGIEIRAVEGFPADCTNLAVHTLLDPAPELVVAGINIGLNHGLGFFLSSGTVGAAAEGWIAGLPAFAFSTGTSGDDRSWKAGVREAAWQPRWHALAELAAEIVEQVMARGFPAGVDLINVNFPVEADRTTPRVVTSLAPVGYGALFRHQGADVYTHDFAGGLREPVGIAGSDIEAIGRGQVSITPVRLAHAAPIDPGLKDWLERGDPRREGSTDDER